MMGEPETRRSEAGRAAFRRSPALPLGVADDPFKDWPWQLGDHKEPRMRAVALVPELVEQARTARDEGATPDVRREASALLAKIYDKRCGICGGELGWDPGDDSEPLGAACGTCTLKGLRAVGRIP